ncbi:MAG: D-alanyl-D-alanine carboxypeptidase [Defluviitaleaceae bacterium]|nr:D-alanyl-D-alanine carboxypeptidase [Defluviitaleaceae bacterium]
MKKVYLITSLLLCLFSALTVKAAKPEVDAYGAVLIDADTGRVLWGKKEHEPLAMASTTKIMTAIVALESGRFDEEVTVSRKAASAPKVKMNLSTGEKVKLGDLMLALMLESSNDAAVAIAEHLHESVADFCAFMTERAREIGAKDTVFKTASGLDLDDHHSTPYDLAVITRYALGVPGFIDLTNTHSTRFSSDKREYSFTNRNRFLHEYPGANGVKTGYTNKAGHCFVGAAKRKVEGEDMQLISVVLASGWGNKGRNQKYKDSREILDYGFANYVYEVILTSQGDAGDIPVTRSRTDSVGYIYESGVRLPLNKEEKETIRVELCVPANKKAPIKQGDTMGSASVYIGDDVYTTIQLVATEDAARHDLKTSIEKVLNAFVEQITNAPVTVTLPELFDE